MRFHLKSTRRAKKVAQSLKRQLADRGRSLTLSECHAATARIYGYASWHELVKDTQRSRVKDQSDDAVSSDEAARRRQFHIEALADHLSLSQEEVGKIVTALAPTGHRKHENVRIPTAEELSATLTTVIAGMDEEGESPFYEVLATMLRRLIGQGRQDIIDNAVGLLKTPEMVEKAHIHMNLLGDTIAAPSAGRDHARVLYAIHLLDCPEVQVENVQALEDALRETAIPANAEILIVPQAWSPQDLKRIDQVQRADLLLQGLPAFDKIPRAANDDGDARLVLVRIEFDASREDIEPSRDWRPETITQWRDATAAALGISADCVEAFSPLENVIQSALAMDIGERLRRRIIEVLGEDGQDENTLFAHTFEDGPEIIIILTDEKANQIDTLRISRTFWRGFIDEFYGTLLREADGVAMYSDPATFAAPERRRAAVRKLCEPDTNLVDVTSDRVTEMGEYMKPGKTWMERDTAWRLKESKLIARHILDHFDPDPSLSYSEKHAAFQVTTKDVQHDLVGRPHAKLQEDDRWIPEMESLFKEAMTLLEGDPRLVDLDEPRAPTTMN